MVITIEITPEIEEVLKKGLEDHVYENHYDVGTYEGEIDINGIKHFVSWSEEGLDIVPHDFMESDHVYEMGLSVNLLHHHEYPDIVNKAKQEAIEDLHDLDTRS